MACVLANMVPLLRPSGMVHQSSSSGQEANDQKILCLPAEEVPPCRPGGMVPSLRPSGMVRQNGGCTLVCGGLCFGKLVLGSSPSQTKWRAYWLTWSHFSGQVAWYINPLRQARRQMTRRSSVCQQRRSHFADQEAWSHLPGQAAW